MLHDGEITDFAVGVTNVSTGEPATTGTIYQCGSMTKTWTALAFMQLVDEGKVGLDEPVRTYLPGFRVADPEVSAKVTPRHLLNHTSGIEEDFGDPGEDDDVYERMVENIADAPQVHPLGYTHGYSAALGYAILARVMEVVDGKRWDDIMTDRLFDPLGLTSTSSRRAQVDQARAATGHVIRSLDEGPIVTPVDYLPRAYGPGGNVNSTVREVLTMAQVFLDGTRIASAAGDAGVARSRTGPVPLRSGMGSGSDRVRLAGRDGVRERRQHHRPERPAADPAGLEPRHRDADERRTARELLQEGVQRDPGRPRRGHDPGPAGTGPDSPASTCPGTKAFTGGPAPATRWRPRAASCTSPCPSIR